MDVITLWYQYRDSLLEDFFYQRRVRLYNQNITISDLDYDQTLRVIDSALQDRCGQSLGDIQGMPQPLYSGSPTYVQRLLARETAYNRTQCRLQYDRRV